MYISRQFKSSTLPWQCLHELCWFQIIAEQEQSEASENFPFSEDLLVEPETDGCSLDLYTQTRLEGNSAAAQTRKKNLSKGKMLSRNLYLVVFSFTFHSYFILILLGVQTKAATKSKGVRCTLLKDLFVTPTPRQSKNDNTDFKERKWMPRTPYPWFTPLLNPIFNLKKTKTRTFVLISMLGRENSNILLVIISR